MKCLLVVVLCSTVQAPHHPPTHHFHRPPAPIDAPVAQAPSASAQSQYSCQDYQSFMNMIGVEGMKREAENRGIPSTNVTRELKKCGLIQ